jgi:hypothetical protein
MTKRSTIDSHRDSVSFASKLADLSRMLESGTIEERREFLSHFVKEIEADPAGKSVRISLYRSLFISIIVEDAT